MHKSGIALVTALLLAGTAPVLAQSAAGERP